MSRRRQFVVSPPVKHGFRVLLDPVSGDAKERVRRALEQVQRGRRKKETNRG